MIRPRVLQASIILAAMLIPNAAFPCTTFCFKTNGQWIFGRTYDWDVEKAFIVVNKRGLAKTACLPQKGEDSPARWTAKFGSVTINQYGREFPLGGMNEAGLVIEVMKLNQAEYPLIDGRPALRELQWVQYQLDTSATVADIIASDKKVRIESSDSIPLHFLACDRTGQAAVIEFLSGHMQAYTNTTLPVPALTNNTYEYCLDFWNKTGGNLSHPAFKNENSSLQRFIQAGRGVKNWNSEHSGEPVAYAFQILDEVTVPITMFRIVYDAGAGVIYFRTKSRPAIRSIRVRSYDYACATPTKILDILADLRGDVTEAFTDYTWQKNLDLIRKSFRGTWFLKETPDSALEETAKYPESLICQ